MELIQNNKDLRDWFLNLSSNQSSPMMEKTFNRGVNVSTKIRRETLTDSHQGRIIIKGTVKQIHFEGIGGGVWLAKVRNLQ